jgi:hypothetical protein
MKKKVRSILLFSLLILSIIMTSAISCSINAGPGGSYSITVYNNHLLNTLIIYKNGAFLVTIPGGGTYTNSTFASTDYIRIWNQSASFYLQDSSLNTTWYIGAYYTFTYSGGVTINVTAVLDAQR